MIHYGLASNPTTACMLATIVWPDCRRAQLSSFTQTYSRVLNSIIRKCMKLHGNLMDGSRNGLMENSKMWVFHIDLSSLSNGLPFQILHMVSRFEAPQDAGRAFHCLLNAASNRCAIRCSELWSRTYGSCRKRCSANYPQKKSGKLQHCHGRWLHKMPFVAAVVI